MTKKIKQKKSKTTKSSVQASTKGAIKKTSTQIKKVSLNVKTAKNSKTEDVATEAAKTSAEQKQALPAVVETKPAVSGREAARLALMQKAASSKWALLYGKANKIKAVPYNLKHEYEIETAIHHKTLGWGYIQDKKNDRLEVLFENGIKYLISNYK